jgi:hypothetical protein
VKSRTKSTFGRRRWKAHRMPSTPRQRISPSVRLTEPVHRGRWRPRSLRRRHRSLPCKRSLPAPLPRVRQRKEPRLRIIANESRTAPGVHPARAPRIAANVAKLPEFDLARELDPATVTANCLHPATYMATTMVLQSGLPRSAAPTEEQRRSSTSYFARTRWPFWRVLQWVETLKGKRASL